MPQHHLLVHKDCCVKHVLTLKGVSVFSLCGTWSSVPSVLLLFKLDVTSGTLLKSVFEIKHINKLEGYRTETGKLFALTCQHFQCLKQFHQRERITESIRLEKISETIESNLWPNTTTSTRPGYLSAMSRKYTKFPIIPIPQKTMGAKSKEQLCLETLLSKQQLDIRDCLKQCAYLIYQNKPNALANSMLLKAELSIISTLCAETTSEDY